MEANIQKENNKHFLEENNIDLQFIPQDVCPDVKDRVNQPTPPPSYDVVSAKQQELNSHPQIDPNLSGYGGNTTQGAAPQSIESPCILYGTAGTYSQRHQVHPPTVQSLGGGYGWCTPMGAAPIQYQGPPNIMQPGPQYNQAGSYIQGQNNKHFLEENNIDLQFIPQDVCPDVKDQVNQPTPPPSYDVVSAKQQELNSHPQIDPNLSGYGGNTTQGAAPQSIESPCILYGTAGTYSQRHQVHPPTVQSLGGGYGWCTPMGAAPIQYQGPPNIMQPGPQYNQAGSYIQGQNNKHFLEENNIDLQFIPQDVCPDVKDQVNQPTPPPSYDVVSAKQQELNSHPQIDLNLSGYGGNTTQGAAPQSIEPPCILYGSAGTYSQRHQVHPPTVQSLGGGYGWCTPMGAAPIQYQGPPNIMQPGPQYNQAGSYIQGQNNNHFLEENNIDLQFIPQDVCPDVKDQVNQPTPLPSYDVVSAKQQELNSHPQIDLNLSGYGGNTTQGAAPQSIEPPCILYGSAGTYSQRHQVHPPTVQSLGGGYGWCTPMGAAPIQYQGPPNIMQPGPQYNQAGSYIQGQHNNIMMTQLQMNLNQSTCPVGVVNGQPVYGLPSFFPTTFTSAAPPSLPPPPPPSTSNLKKRKRDDKHDDRTYVKKPPNAFMLFMKEERPKYVATMKGIGTAGVNKFLGDKWSMLSKEEKEIYYEQAHKEKLLHAQQHPEWSARDNYGQMRKKDRSKAPNTEASAGISEEVTQPAQKKCVTTYADVTVDPHTQSSLMEQSNSMESSQSQPPISTNDGDLGNLTSVESTSMDSPAALDDNQGAESSHLSGVVHPHMAEMFELLERVESLPAQTQQPISEIQTAQLEHFALLNNPLEEWFIDMLKSPPPVPQTQQPISEAVQSQTTESDDFTRLEDSKAMSFMDLPKSHPPDETQTQEPISENQTTEPDPFAWLDEAMAFSFVDMLEFPFMPQTNFSNSMDSPTALGNYERVESNYLAGAEHL